MPVRTDPWPVGTPCWADLAVPDIDAAERFYGAVLGWEFQDTGPEYGNYRNALVDGAAAAGLSPQFQAGMPVAWTTYFATGDIEATAEKVRAAGGTVVMGPMPLMDLGSMAVATDPGGAAFALWQAGSHTGFGHYRDNGALVWEELAPGEGGAAAAKQFYGDVFELDFTPMDGGYMFRPAEGTRIDDEHVGSIGAPEAETATPAWRLWFVVPDTDAAAAAAAANGGKVVGPPAPGPFGREARLLDPAGAELHVITPAMPE